MKPYGLMSDLHAHNWSAFSELTPEGVNNRLLHITNELDRCCETVRKEGGHRVVIAGDLFHTRGSVAPSVFNPVKAVIDAQVIKGMEFVIIPGNHDLESRDSRVLTSAVAMLDGGNVRVYHKPALAPHRVAVVPWEPKQSDLLFAIEHVIPKDERKDTDLIIHAGIDGVLKGMPDHGLTAEMLGKFGFRRVFAGHYHNHADMGHGVYSIGSPTHQTWSDVGTKAGWMLVWPDRVKWYASHAPSFIDLTGTESQEELPLIVDGHYVRAKINEATASEVQSWREALMKAGAKGVVIQATPKASTPVRSGSSSAAIERIDVAIADYCKAQGLTEDVTRMAIETLSEVTA